MRKVYFDTAEGQVHARYWNDKIDGIPFLCLPPAPHTGLYFKTFAEYIDLPVIAIDYPGSGGSTPLEKKPSIEDYARIIGGLLPKIGKVNLVGFHSGCLIALAMADSIASQIENIICIDFPYFDANTRKKYAKNFQDVQPPEKAEGLSKSFEGTVAKRRDEIGEPRALELWVESLRAGPRYNDIFQAAFAYDVDAALGRSSAPIHLIATKSGLLEPTRQANRILKNGRLTEVMEITGNVFETGAAVIANTIRDDII